MTALALCRSPAFAGTCVIARFVGGQDRQNFYVQFCHGSPPRQHFFLPWRRGGAPQLEPRGAAIKVLAQTSTAFRASPNFGNLVHVPNVDHRSLYKVIVPNGRQSRSCTVFRLPLSSIRHLQDPGALRIHHTLRVVHVKRSDTPTQSAPMAGLPPETIHVKRKRGTDDNPVDFLRPSSPAA